jgi:hypothetical protein
MPRITVHAVNSDGEPRRWTLSERIAADNLDSEHYIDQLIERLTWATADAEEHESRSDGRRSADIGREPPVADRPRPRSIPSFTAAIGFAGYFEETAVTCLVTVFFTPPFGV